MLILLLAYPYTSETTLDQVHGGPNDSTRDRIADDFINDQLGVGTNAVRALTGYAATSGPRRFRARPSRHPRAKGEKLRAGDFHGHAFGQAVGGQRVYSVAVSEGMNPTCQRGVGYSVSKTKDSHG